MLCVYLLGDLHLASDATWLPRLATQKAASLLAYLVMHPGRHYPREVLAEMLWPNRPSENARRSLHTALWQIRRVLKQAHLNPNDYLFASNLAIAWCAPPSSVWLDIREFETCADATEIGALQRAVELYRGEFLDGVYDDWCLEERYRLQEKLLQALSRLTDLCLVDHRFADALAFARRTLQADNLREDAYRAAMLALYQLGQRTAALDQFAVCARVLKAELNVAPSAETRALYQAIVNESLPKLTPSRPLTVAAESQQAARAPYDPERVPFAGRASELRQLSAWWQRRREPLALISGEAGVGKTRLAHEWSVAQGYLGTQVGLGHCYAFERVLPYQAIGEALRELVALTPDATLAALPGWVIAELVRLLPGLTERLPGWMPSDSQDQARLFDAITRALSHLAASQPVLFVIEDLHQAADSTLALLEYLLRRGQGNQRVRWLATARQEDLASGDINALLQRLRRDALVFEVPLKRLDAHAVAAWIGAWSGLGERASALAARLYRETEGNPFFLTETIKLLFETGELCDEGRGWEGAVLAGGGLPFPRSAQELIQARLRRLPARTLEALNVAAVMGKEFDLNVLRLAWGGSEDDALTALDDLLRAQLIRESVTSGGRDYAFTHDKIQETAYADLPGAKRAALHRRVGAALEAAYGAEAAAELVHHYRQAGEMLRAVQWGIRAGERALALSAYGDARRYLEQARENLGGLGAAAIAPEQHMALYAGLCDVYWSSRSATQLVPAAESLLSLAQATGDVPYQVEALWRLGLGYGLARDARCYATFEQARALAEEAQHRRLPNILHALATYIGWSRGDWRLALERLDEAATAARRMGVRLDVWIAIGTGRMFTSDLGGSIAAYQQAALEWEALGDQGKVAVALNNLAEDYLLLHLPERAREPLRHDQEILNTLGTEDADTLRLVGWMHHLSGDFVEARRWLQRALDLARETNHVHYLREVLHNICAFLIDAGEPERALELAQEFCSNPACDWGEADLLPAYTRGLVWLALDRLDEAEADLTLAVQKGERTHTSPRLWELYIALGRLRARQGQGQAARAAYDRARQLISELARSLDPFPDVRQEFLNAVLPRLNSPQTRN
jgi:DNA-binding SARP family transcriptional activator